MHQNRAMKQVRNYGQAGGIASSVGFVPRNALGLTEPINSRMVGAASSSNALRVLRFYDGL
jgi:hypothetical protein